MVPVTWREAKIDDGDGMAGMRIPAVDAIAVDRNVGGFVIGRDGQIVRRDAHFQVGNLLEIRWIEETDMPCRFCRSRSIRASRWDCWDPRGRRRKRAPRPRVPRKRAKRSCGLPLVDYISAERRKRRAAGESTRFHHIKTPVTKRNAGARPMTTHSALLGQPPKLPKCR